MAAIFHVQNGGRNSICWAHQTIVFAYELKDSLVAVVNVIRGIVFFSLFFFLQFVAAVAVVVDCQKPICTIIVSYDDALRRTLTQSSSITPSNCCLHEILIPNRITLDELKADSPVKFSFLSLSVRWSGDALRSKTMIKQKMRNWTIQLKRFSLKWLFECMYLRSRRTTSTLASSSSEKRKTLHVAFITAVCQLTYR